LENSFRMILLHEREQQLPWNHTLAQKGGGGGSSAHLLCQTRPGLTPLESTQPICENCPMPSDIDVQIRPAKESDVRLVFDFIRKLAEYGDISSEAVVAEADVRAALFGARPVAEAVLAFVGSEPAGFAVFSMTFASFMGKPGIFVEDFFVEHRFRGHGIGKALLVTLARLGRERGCGRLEWSVLNWNEQAMEFYQDLGAVPMDEWTTFRLTGESLERLASGESPRHWRRAVNRT
jgi:GNAT superfamily N-acetyltransferase